MRIQLRHPFLRDLLFAFSALASRHTLAATLASAVILCAAPTVAQDDRAAGLFTPAGQLPLTQQALDVTVVGAVATVLLEQTFANRNEHVAQADYRVVLPRSANLVGFGFFKQGMLHAATLKDKRIAERDHRAAADAGRATGIARSDVATHSFSVFPLAPKEVQRIQLTVEIPVHVLDGLSTVKLPVDHFLGQSPGVASTDSAAAPVRTLVTATVEDPLGVLDLDMRGASSVVQIPHPAQHAASSVVADVTGPVELAWRSEGKSDLVRVSALPLGDGSQAVEVVVTMDTPTTMTPPSSAKRLALFVDASASMRRHAWELERVFERLKARSKIPIEVIAVSDGKRAEKFMLDDTKDSVARILAPTHGFGVRKRDFRAAMRPYGCDGPAIKCALVVDGTFRELGWATKAEVPALVLASADDADREEDLLGVASKANVVVDASDSLQDLKRSADALVFPAVDVVLASVHGMALTFLGRPRLQVSEGGQGRFFALVPGTTPPQRVDVDLHAQGREHSVQAAVRHLKADSAVGKGLRREVFRAQLDDLERAYRRHPTVQQQKDIVALSVREGIPTALTAWHAESVTDESGELIPALEGSAQTRGAGGLGIGGLGFGGGGRSVGKAASTVRSPMVGGVFGAMRKDVIRRVVRENLGRLRYCYERELAKNPGLHGRFVVVLTIAENGRAVHRAIDDDTLGNAQVSKCVLSKFSQFRFPSPPGGTSVIVRYPLVFDNAPARAKE